MVATTLAEQYGDTSTSNISNTLDQANQQAMQMYTGNKDQQRLALRQGSSLSSDPGRWSQVSGNRYAGGTDISPNLMNIPNDDGSFNALKGQSTAGGQTLNQYYGKHNPYTDEGRQGFIKENILDKGWKDIGQSPNNIASRYFNEADADLLTNSLGKFYNTHYGKGDFNWNKLPTYGLPSGYTEKDMGKGQFEMFDPSGKTVGLRYGSMDDAIAGYTRELANKGVTQYNDPVMGQVMMGGGDNQYWENQQIGTNSGWGFGDTKGFKSQQEAQDAYYNQMMGRYSGANTSLRKAEILSALASGKPWQNLETAQSINDKYMQGVNAAWGAPEEFGSDLALMYALQQPHVDTAHTQNRDAFGNNQTDSLSSLYDSTPVFRNGQLAGYEGNFLSSPEQQQWADAYKFDTGSNALTRKTTQGIDKGQSALAAGYGDAFKNYNLGNGKFFMTPAQAAADANIPIYDQYARNNQSETGPSLGMNIGKYATMATMAAMGAYGGGLAAGGLGATSNAGIGLGAGIGGAVPGAMSTGLNTGDWGKALGQLGMGAVSGGLGGALSPAINSALGSLGSAVPAQARQAIAQAVMGAGTTGVKNLLQGNRLGQGMGEATVMGALSGLGTTLAGNAGVAPQQTKSYGNLASSAGNLGYQLYKNSKTKKG